MHEITRIERGRDGGENYHYNCVSYVVWCSFRYGLPVNFQAMLLQPNKKTLKKLREVLNELYKHLDSSAAAIIDVSLPYFYLSSLLKSSVDNNGEI